MLIRAVLIHALEFYLMAYDRALKKVKFSCITMTANTPANLEQQVSSLYSETHQCKYTFQILQDETPLKELELDPTFG